MQEKAGKAGLFHIVVVSIFLSTADVRYCCCLVASKAKDKDAQVLFSSLFLYEKLVFVSAKLSRTHLCQQKKKIRQAKMGNAIADSSDNAIVKVRVDQNDLCVTVRCVECDRRYVSVPLGGGVEQDGAIGRRQRDQASGERKRDYTLRPRKHNHDCVSLL
jgi:hypothetical protein